jgi:hypothetical protein
LPQSQHWKLSLISQSGFFNLVPKINLSTQKKMLAPIKFAMHVATKRLMVVSALKRPSQQIKTGAKTGVESCQRRA